MKNVNTLRTDRINSAAF